MRVFVAYIHGCKNPYVVLSAIKIMMDCVVLCCVVSHPLILAHHLSLTTMVRVVLQLRCWNCVARICLIWCSIPFHVGFLSAFYGVSSLRQIKKNMWVEGCMLSISSVVCGSDGEWHTSGPHQLNGCQLAKPTLSNDKIMCLVWRKI